MLTYSADCDHQQQNYPGLSHLKPSEIPHNISISLLTGGSDRPYVFGLATALISQGVSLDMIGSDELDFPEFQREPRIRFLNLRGSTDSKANPIAKIARVLRYYARLIGYAATAKPGIFHILWNNKFETFDRTFLMLYYRLLQKNIVLTVHNVNAGRRDSRDSRLNRLTLRIQYRLSKHIFVHTEKMKSELTEQFGGRGASITVIPFGINNTVPNTSLTPSDAKRRLGFGEHEKAILFFGNIRPYKGLEYLIAAFRQVLAMGVSCRLIIVGRPSKCEEYWAKIRNEIREDVQSGQVLLKAEFIPDDEAEVYFKAADVLVLPYREIYQSGVLFTGYSFGLPVIAAEVGSLKDEIVEGSTGFVFRPEDPADLAKAIQRYFASDLYADLRNRRGEISAYAMETHSWGVVGQMTKSVYANLLRMPLSRTPLNPGVPSASHDVEVS